MPNTTPLSQETKHPVARTRKTGLPVEAMPISCCRHRMAARVRERARRHIVLCWEGVYNQAWWLSAVFWIEWLQGAPQASNFGVLVQMLPMDELMKANLSRLTTSHHGDLWPPVSMAKRELEMMRAEHPSRHIRGNGGRGFVERRLWTCGTQEGNQYHVKVVWHSDDGESYQSQTRWDWERAANTGSTASLCSGEEEMSEAKKHRYSCKK